MKEIEHDCPFCGIDDYAELIKNEYDNGLLEAYVKCHNCHARGPLHMFFPPDEITDGLYRHNENIHENRNDVIPAAIDDWNTPFERMCQMSNEDWADSFGEYKHLYECDICSESTALLYCVNENGDTDWVMPKFCGHCGAKVVVEV